MGAKENINKTLKKLMQGLAHKSAKQAMEAHKALYQIVASVLPLVSEKFLLIVSLCRLM